MPSSGLLPAQTLRFPQPLRALGQAITFLAAFAAFAAAAVPSAPAREVTQAESDQAFRIFLNVKEELVQRCVYQPTELAVLTGTLKALERELDPEFAPYFPQQLPANFAEAWPLAQKALRRLAEQPELESRTLQSLVEQGLRTYCRSLDRYSDYDDLAGYEMEVKLKSPPYVGVGMTIERTAEGFDLFPFPSGPADFAGCFPGDRLLEVDGKTVRGLGKIDVGAMFSGTAGSEVRVKVRRAFDRKEDILTVKRGPIEPAFISVEQEPTGPIVRLRRLTAATVRDLRVFLRTARPGTPLTLDLRGCPGGEFDAAIEIARLFLPAGSIICKVETRRGPEVFRSDNPRPFLARPLLILQNRGTMSGAELLTAALVTSPTIRATSLGERSYGKGVTLVESLVESGGGRVRYAEGRIFGPRGEFWDGEGLAPTTEDRRKP